MENKIQCPQCGAANAVKTSATMYHCTYCESNFEVQPSKQELIAEILERQKQSSSFAQENLRQAYQQVNVQVAAAQKRGARSITSGVLIAMLVVGLAVFYNIRGTLKHAGVLGGGDWQDPTINKYVVFAGSKGPVAWTVLEQSSNRLDSARYTLKIVDPSKKTMLSEFLLLPVMTWSDGFNSGKMIGDFYAFGDTCWEASEENGLIARDLYSGKVIIDGKDMAKLSPKFSAGISKASYHSTDRIFEVTTTDGFAYYFSPDSKRVFTNDEWDKLRRDKSVKRTFFILSEAQRPLLFKSVEKTSPYDYSSSVFSNELNDYQPGKKLWGLSDHVISLEQVLQDKAFFNGNVVWNDNRRALILYQLAMGKTSPLHACCISADGRQLWDIGGNDLGDFHEQFSQSNFLVDFANSKDDAILYCGSADNKAVALNWNTGKIDWKYSADKDLNN